MLFRSYEITFAIHLPVPFVFLQIYVVYIVGSDMRFCAQISLCLLTILIAAKGSGIAQLRTVSKTSECVIFDNFIILIQNTNIDKYF